MLDTILTVFLKWFKFLVWRTKYFCYFFGTRSNLLLHSFIFLDNCFCASFSLKSFLLCFTRCILFGSAFSFYFGKAFLLCFTFCLFLSLASIVFIKKFYLDKIFIFNILHRKHTLITIGIVLHADKLEFMFTFGKFYLWEFATQSHTDLLTEAQNTTIQIGLNMYGSSHSRGCVGSSPLSQNGANSVGNKFIDRFLKQLTKHHIGELVLTQTLHHLSRQTFRHRAKCAIGIDRDKVFTIIHRILNLSAHPIILV